jgi:hypothetical protein
MISVFLRLGSNIIFILNLHILERDSKDLLYTDVKCLMRGLSIISDCTYSTLGQAKHKADSNLFTFPQAHLLRLSSMQIAIRCFFIGTILGDVDVCTSLMLVLLIKAHKNTKDDHCEQNNVTEALYRVHCLPVLRVLYSLCSASCASSQRELKWVWGGAWTGKWCMKCWDAFKQKKHKRTPCNSG